MGLAQALGLWRDVVEWVPEYTTLTVHFGVSGLGDTAQDAAAALLALGRRSAPLSRPGRRWRLPMCLDAEFAPDLHELAKARDLSHEPVVAVMTGTAFRVCMLDFQPGFPYMAGRMRGLPVAQPRRQASDRTHAAGVVQCGKQRSGMAASGRRGALGRHRARLLQRVGTRCSGRCFSARKLARRARRFNLSGGVGVVDAGAGMSIQDRGRTGHRDIGVPLAGAADPVLLARANALLTLAEGLAALEVALLGPVLRADIVSEAVVPGAVQVPGVGQPIVLGVAAQTIGGYAKIVNVIRADLPRLAHARTGNVLRIRVLTRGEALAARL
jgi:hypothetical protein